VSYLIQLIDLLKINYIWFTVLIIIIALVSYGISKYEMVFMFVLMGLTFLGIQLGYYPLWLFYFMILSFIIFTFTQMPKFNGWRL
jgi:hypothetical protein